MFQRYASTALLFGAIVLVSSSCSYSQNQGLGGLGIQPAQITEEMDEASMLEKASMIFGYNAIGRTTASMKQQGIDFDPADVVTGAQMAVDGQEFSPETIKQFSIMTGGTAVKGMAQALQAQGLDLNMAKVLDGVKRAASGRDLGIAQEDAQRIMLALQNKVQTEMREKMMAETKVAAEKNKAAGEAFLAANAKEPGVQKLENGVQYTIVKTGTGAKPTENDQVKLHYHGTKVTGEVFDSSVEKGQPITHSASGFVKGFNAAVQAMNVGSKWKVVIPSDLAYGMNGPLGPNQTLIFEIELLEIVK